MKSKWFILRKPCLLIVCCTLTLMCSKQAAAQYDVEWGTLIGCTQPQPGLLVYDNTSLCAKAISRNAFPAGATGSVQVQPGQTDADKSFGFTKASFTSPPCNLTSIAFGVRFMPGGALQRLVNGVSTPIGTYDTTDLIRIELSTDSVRFYKNELKIAASKYVSAIHNIIVLMQSPGAHFEYMLSSFDVPVTETVAINMCNTINSKMTTTAGAGSNSISAFRLNATDTIRRTLFRFPVDSIPAKAVIVSAYLRLYCTRTSGTYASNLKMISAAWSNTTTWATKPAVLTTDVVAIDTFSAGQWKNINITAPVRKWVNQEKVNYGLELSLKNETTAGLTGQHTLAFASEFSQANQPTVVIQYLADPTFAVLTRLTDGGFHSVQNNNLCFVYNEEYFREENARLCYFIYDETMTVVAGVDRDGIPVNGLSQAPGVTIGMNKYAFDLSYLNLTHGRFYLLEVVNTKNEKWYLRFVY